MIKKIDKNAVREKRHIRVKKNIFGTVERPRMSVYKSLSHIYVQIIDDSTGKTLVSSSTISKDVSVVNKTKSEAASIVGADVAAKALSKGISAVVFDRGGYLYTGRVKALADGARNAGLKF